MSSTPIPDEYQIQGPTRLIGEVKISGAKNAALPILFSSLLAEETVEIQNVPESTDINNAIELLRHLGAAVIKRKNSAFVNSSGVTVYRANRKLAQTMRSSIWIMGPLLARFGKGQTPRPGGCVIGARPIDLHMQSLQQLGAIVELDDVWINAQVDGRLRGAHIILGKVSVGATITVMSAATLAKGLTVIENAAQEPEIVDTANFLVRLGAKISGAGSTRITVEGCRRLGGGIYRVMPDRIETGTFLMGAAISGGRILCHDTCPDTLGEVLVILQRAGAEIEIGKDWISLDMKDQRPRAVNVCTAPYPGFPTDLQALCLLLNLVAEGSGTVIETVFEDRFGHVSELSRMGACAEVKDNAVISRGVGSLCGTRVTATDIRAGACLVLAGCVAQGTTIVDRIYHVDRGYEQFESKLRDLGARIERL